MLWLALHFPALPVEIFTRASPTAEPFVVTEGDHRPTVVAANDSATTAGVRCGMLLSAAYPLVPALLARVRDEDAERQALASVAMWCEQFTSTVSVAPPSALLLEIGSSLRYFGGLSRLRERIRSGLSGLGYRSSAGIAPTPTGARLLARAGATSPVLERDALAATLSRLPLALLDCGAATIDALGAMGVRSLGDALRLPRDGLVRRFGQAIVDEIDRALGRLPDPRPPFVAPPCYRRELELPAPVEDVEALAFGVRRLVDELCGWLLGRGLGVMRMQLALVHDRRAADAAPTELETRLSSPSRTGAHLLAVWRERLSRLELPDRVTRIRLATTETAPLGARNLTLPGAGVDTAQEFTLCDRLRARLGDAAIVVVGPYADHRPEHAWRIESADAIPASVSTRAASAASTNLASGRSRAAATAASTSVTSAAPARRPVWLLSEPEPLGRLFAQDSPWVLMDGPERIESGWWDDRDVRRDYFVARSPRGETCWIYRDARYDDEWFLHGVFG
jgi:protein ImuB